MTSRLFIALHIPDEIVDKIINMRDEIYPNDKFVKWEPKSKLHITLKFLGDTSKESIEPICDRLENVMNDFSALDLTFEKFGVFKRNKIPKIVWAGLAKNINLSNLVGKINDDLEPLGFEKEERTFNPHLTLLRIRGRENFENISKFFDSNFEKIKFTGNKISLFESTLLKSGSVYNTIKSFELK
jgi:2'-5' RNA ligase